MKKEKTYQHVKALHKGLDVLEHIASRPGPVPVSAISEAIGMPVGTILMHLATMESRGYVAQSNGGWKLGDRVAILWAQTFARLDKEKNEIEKRLGMIRV